jgi:hypothetical protein
MNETQPIGHPARDRICSPGLFALILVGTVAMLRAIDATPAAGSIAALSNKMHSRVTDLIQLAETLRGRDQQIAIEIGNVGAGTFKTLLLIRDLLLIESLVQNEADKIKIEPIVDSRVKRLAHDIDLDVKLINTGMAGAHNQALIDTASKLKDDLRELQELLVR